MIIVSLYEDYDVNNYGRPLHNSPKILWVSHGINYDTLQTIGLPTERWSEFKKHCWFYSAIGEWVIS